MGLFQQTDHIIHRCIDHHHQQKNDADIDQQELNPDGNGLLADALNHAKQQMSAIQGWDWQ